MDALEAVLPVFVDYLGSVERERDESAQDAMRELVDFGLKPHLFVANAELSVEKENVVIRDVKARKVVLELSLLDVSDATAFVAPESESSLGLTRVVIFGDESAAHLRSTRLFHAVQCLESHPEELVQQLSRATATATERMKRRTFGLDSEEAGSNTNSVRSLNLGRERIKFNQSIEERKSDREASIISSVHTFNTSPTARRVDRVVSQLERPSFQYATTTDPVTKLSILLNYCLDDIDAFCAELRQVRHEHRGASRRLHSNEINATDFVSAFQKLKLAVNVLAALDTELEETATSELVHNVFPSLAYLMDECYERFDEELIANVSTPQMSLKAIRMLNRVLDDRERIIWESLGAFWLYSSPEIDADFVPYRPVFRDGWSPGYVHLEDDSDMGHRSKKRQQHSQKHSAGLNPNGKIVREDYHGPTEGLYADFRDSIMARGGRLALVIATKEADNAKELSVEKNEYVEVVQMNHNRKWWKCKNIDDQQGFVPRTVLKAIIYKDSFVDEARDDGMKKEGRAAPHAAFEEAEVASSTPPPMPPPMPESPTPSLSITSKLQRATQSSSSDARGRRNSGQSERSLQFELRNVLDLYREKEKHVPRIRVTPDVYISGRSTSHEVQEWLKAKQFSERVREQMVGFDGSKVLAMSLKELILAFGKEEGRRLEGQITLCRNMSQFKTARSSELKTILDKARERVENALHEEEINAEHV